MSEAFSDEMATLGKQIGTTLRTPSLPVDEEKALTLLRVQLYGAMQTLKGERLREFWQLIDEIQGSRALFPRPAEPLPVTPEKVVMTGQEMRDLIRNGTCPQCKGGLAAIDHDAPNHSGDCPKCGIEWHAIGRLGPFVESGEARVEAYPIGERYTGYA